MTATADFEQRTGDKEEKSWTAALKKRNLRLCVRGILHRLAA